MSALLTGSSLQASTERPLPVRRRPDLEVYARQFHGRPAWLVKDPVGLQYFRFQEEEYVLFQMLDGRHSLQQMQQEFARRFPPRTIRADEIHRFMGMLHQTGLVLSDAPGQGRQLYCQAHQRRRWRWWAGAANLLAIRLPGVSPDAFLDRMLPYVGWLFSPAAVGLGCLLILAALASVLVHWDRFLARLPECWEFFRLGYLPAWMLVLAGMKICHELGHALVCKRLGGSCTEIGLMLLVFTPCLYCNVSDAWLWKSKWHRAVVSAAGIYVELVLASLATWLWWWTEPGLLHHLALAAMLIGSVNTVLLNGNPLLRYDGYYILADLLETPNLQQKASAVLARWAGQWFLGLPNNDDRLLPSTGRGWLAFYALASLVYRWFVVVGILWFLSKALEPMRLQIFGQMLAAATLIGLVGWPMYRLFRFFTTPGATGLLHNRRALLSLAGLAMLLLAALTVPWPYDVVCPVEIRAAGAASIYVEVPGQLVAVLVQPGQWVQPGQPLAELRNLDAEWEIARLETLREEYRVRLQNARWQQHRDPAVAAELRQWEEALRTIEEQLAKRQEDLSRLTLTSPIQGVVFAPPTLPEASPHPLENPSGRLPTWTDSPLATKNLGAWLEPGTLFCLVGHPSHLEAVLLLDQTEVQWVQEGQPVKILLDAYPHQVIQYRQTETGPTRLEIAEVSRSENSSSLSRLSWPNSAALPGKNPVEKQPPDRPTYQARVWLGNSQGLLRPGLTGLARIRTENLTLAHRLWRLVCHTFRIR